MLIQAGLQSVSSGPSRLAYHFQTLVHRLSLVTCHSYTSNTHAHHVSCSNPAFGTLRTTGMAAEVRMLNHHIPQFLLVPSRSDCRGILATPMLTRRGVLRMIGIFSWTRTWSQLLDYFVDNWMMLSTASGRSIKLTLRPLMFLSRSPHPTPSWRVDALPLSITAWIAINNCNLKAEKACPKA